MNQGLHEIETFFNQLKTFNLPKNVIAGIAPQFIHLHLLKAPCQQLGLQLGAQNCSEFESGAYTGEVSPLSLKQLDLNFVIIGHSERRAIFKESHEQLKAKVLTCLKNKLKVVFCIGELLEERKSDLTEQVLKKQITDSLNGLSPENLSELILAYEPVWAIGTGLSATVDEAQAAHLFIRKTLKELLGEKAQFVPILYGGSVKPDNIENLLKGPDVDGALVGGASLKANDFYTLVEKASKQD